MRARSRDVVCDPTENFRAMKLEELVEHYHKGTLNESCGAPEDYELHVVVDKGCAIFSLTAGWDEDGEERDGDPIYVTIEESEGAEQIQTMLKILGVPSERA